MGAVVGHEGGAGVAYRRTGGNDAVRTYWRDDDRAEVHHEILLHFASGECESREDSDVGECLQQVWEVTPDILVVLDRGWKERLGLG